MFSATHFTYDGVYSGEYGVRIASFDGSSGAEETPILTPTVNLKKSLNAKRFCLSSIKYEEAPEHTFSIVSDVPLHDYAREEILNWLFGKPGFKRLQIHQPDLESYYYNCIFTSANTIHIGGRCVGFTVTVKFDSPYAYGESIRAKFTANATEQTISINNSSDTLDGFVSPVIYIEVGGSNISKITIGDIVIDSGADTNIFAGDNITIDNEIKRLSSYNGKNYMPYFNKQWLRFAKGENKLKMSASGNCDVTIVCPTYKLIGF